MKTTYEDILNLIRACEDYNGPLFESEAVKKIADELQVSKVAYRIFSGGVNTSSEVIYVAPSSKLGDEYDFSRQTTDTKKVVMRIYRFPYALKLEGEQLDLFNIFADTILSSVGAKNLSKAYDDIFYYDQLTGMPNKTLFFKKLTSLIGQSIQDRYAIVYANIKNCKIMNKLFGYETTDKMLRDFALDINDILDTKNHEIIARLGGDNFVLIVLKEHLDDVLKFISAVKVSTENNEDVIEYIINVHAGVVLMSAATEDPGMVMSAANVTVTLARRSTAKDIIYYNENTDNILNNERSYVEELKRDLKDGKFIVYYQPIFSKGDTEEIAGAEALVRWRKDGHIVTPSSFIEVAEQNNLISDIDLYVLDTVCSNLKKWQEEGMALVPISFNFSHYDLITSDITEEIIKTLDKYDIDHSLINIEFTEAGFHEEYEALVYAASKLKSNGISVTIDNYGHGYSSIKLLQELEVDSIKFSYDFISSDNPRADVILEGLITIANRLGLNVVAQGVQSESEVDKLVDFGCNLFQTELFGKAVSERFFVSKLRSKAQ